jgi:DNA-binding beta-propeller fold protein YncE
MSQLIICLSLVLTSISLANGQTVSTIIGTGTPGFSDNQVNNPYGVVIGPDGQLYFCDLDNQRIRSVNLKTHKIKTIAGNGQRGYSGDGGPATEASLNMPHEIRFDTKGDLYIVERDNHTVRKVDMKAKLISTIAGTGVGGFSGDGGLASKAQLRSPHSIAFAKDGNLFICDVGNHRVRQVDLSSGNCRDMYNQIVSLGQAVSEAMADAEDTAGRVLSPGRIREIERRHSLEWGGWGRGAPELRDHR